MLRLVHPAPQGQEIRPPKGHKSPAFYPNADERARIQAAARNLARALGGYDVLAAIIKVPVTTLYKVRSSSSYGMAVLIARAANIPVEQILSGRPYVAGSCVVCGRKGDR